MEEQKRFALKSPSRGVHRNTLFEMLTAEERAILDFERAWWTEPGPKDQAIEFSLGLSSSAYYETLRRVINDSAAFEYDPLTVKRVLAMLEQPADTELAV